MDFILQTCARFDLGIHVQAPCDIYIHRVSKHPICHQINHHSWLIITRDNNNNKITIWKAHC